MALTILFKLLFQLIRSLMIIPEPDSPCLQCVINTNSHTVRLDLYHKKVDNPTRSSCLVLVVKKVKNLISNRLMAQHLPIINNLISTVFSAIL